ncbi:MAG: STAS domain-containing protein [Leptolyngbyaceae cyanobacterium]
MMKHLVNQISQAVVYPTGHIDASNVQRFRAQLEDALQSTFAAGLSNTLVIDMSQVESLDSTGLMVLLDILSTAQAQAIQLALCSVPGSIKIMLELTQLDRVFYTVPASGGNGLASSARSQSAVSLVASMVQGC